MNLAPERSRLVRVLEPEAMESADDARDYDAMDHSVVNRAFVEEFLAAVAARHGSPVGTVLDLGTGTAQIPIELCRATEAGHVLAIDVAESMLEWAKTNVARAGFADRVSLALVDAKLLPYADGSFSAVMSNSIVHHIPEPGDVLAEAVRVTEPGGILFVRDLARPADEAQVNHLVATYAGQCNEHQRQLFDDSLRAALSIEEMRALVVNLGFDTATVAATSDRHWTWHAVRK